MLSESLLIKVIEAPNGDEFFVIGRKLILYRDKFSVLDHIENSENREYQSNGLAKFGRESNISEYQSDLKFLKSRTEISRRQFQINMSDVDSFSIQCVSPNETYFKVKKKKKFR
jgi:hypothetical protein